MIIIEGELLPFFVDDKNSVDRCYGSRIPANKAHTKMHVQMAFIKTLGVQTFTY